MGQRGIYADTYLVWQRRTQAQKTWVAFKTYWTDTFQEHKDINNSTSENVRFRANSEMESGKHDKKLDAEMENLVEIMSSDKSQVETLFATNAQLAKTTFRKGCNDHTINKRNVKSSENYHQNFR